MKLYRPPWRAGPNRPQLPTLARIALTYQLYRFPTAGRHSTNPGVATRAVYDAADQDMKDVAVYHRDDLVIGSFVPGPAVIAEDETTTIVPKSFAARINPIGAILMEKVQP